MTVIEALNQVRTTLNGIHVPISETAAIAIPIAQAAELLGQCIDALDQHAEDQPAAGAAGEAASQ